MHDIKWPFNPPTLISYGNPVCFDNPKISAIDVVRVVAKRLQVRLAQGVDLGVRRLRYLVACHVTMNENK